MINLSYALPAAGLGIAAAGSVLLLITITPSRSSINRLKGIKLKIKQLRKEEKQSDNVPLFTGIGLGILFAGAGRNLQEAMVMFSAGVFVGIVGTRLLRRVYRKTKQERLLEEIETLCDSVGMSIRAGYTLLQSLRSSIIFVPYISKYINRCIAAWPSSSKKALEQLRKDINTPEGDMCVAVLLQIEVSGQKNSVGNLEKVARDIEQIRQYRLESKIANRPLYFMFYKLFLPMIIIMGLILGPLLYRLHLVLDKSGLLTI